MCIYGNIPDPVEVGVWFRDDYEWRLYDVITSQLIKAAYVDAEKSLTFTVESGVHPGGARYTVDLRTMQQRNAASGMVRPIKIVMEETTTAARVRATKPAAAQVANGIISSRASSESGLTSAGSTDDEGFVHVTAAA